MNRTAGLALIAACAVALTACGPATSSSSNPNPVVPATPAAKAGTPAESSGVDVCGYLRGQIPALKAVGSDVGAMAQLTIGLYDFYDKQGKVPNGLEIEANAQKNCPDVAEQVYKIAGIKSFAAL
ncbi:hypothetical protein [Actinokineospora sp. NBRC 105648]|uniref:hypothetical protein n=1 Tax=Actinokineospora sp. NBRC 105648 TaxID=3032206 RepID=UPI0024A4D7F1|nr:hypothetical protein [Actinokineospora sp. NBRC 105648]GLZ39230.1 hypothetical protein Acsp05_28540 [Actinokineospora sp. NBRC 105648]